MFSLIKQLFARDDREAGPRDDREAAPAVRIAIVGGQVSDREALRTYERAGLSFFA